VTVEEDSYDLADESAHLQPGKTKTKLQIHQIVTTVVTAGKVLMTEINLEQIQRRMYKMDQTSTWMKTVQTGNEETQAEDLRERQRQLFHDDKRYADDVII